MSDEYITLEVKEAAIIMTIIERLTDLCGDPEGMLEKLIQDGFDADEVQGALDTLAECGIESPLDLDEFME